METTRKVDKARLIPIGWDKNNKVIPDLENSLYVQFNPASLKVSYANKTQTHDQGSGSAIQHLGRSSSTLSADLIFDVSGANASDTRDVRNTTQRIADFMRATTKESQKKPEYKIYGVRFQWGTFLFDGILESMNETLELWSEDGRPLRSTVSISLQQPGIHETSEHSNSLAVSIQGGITPMTPAPLGANLQTMVANARADTDWKTIAARNGIENPRHLPPGTLINLQT